MSRKISIKIYKPINTQKTLASAIASMMLALVSVMVGAPFGGMVFKLYVFYELTFVDRLCQEINMLSGFISMGEFA